MGWFLSGAMGLAACSLFGLASPPSQFVWAMEAKHPHASMTALRSAKFAAYRRSLGLGKDFIAAFDVAPDARPFGRLIAMLSVGNAMMAHHTNYAMPPNDILYANDWLGNRTYVFNLPDQSLGHEIGCVEALVTSYRHAPGPRNLLQHR